MPAESVSGSVGNEDSCSHPTVFTGRRFHDMVFGLESLATSIPGADNPYFSAGFGLGILGTGLAALRGSAKLASTLAQRHLLVTLEVTSKDKAYP